VKIGVIFNTIIGLCLTTGLAQAASDRDVRRRVGDPMGRPRHSRRPCTAHNRHRTPTAPGKSALQESS